MVKISESQEKNSVQLQVQSFPFKILRFILWIALIGGIIAAIVNIVLILIWPDRAGLNLPVGILQSTRTQSGLHSEFLATTYQSQVPPVFEYTNGQYTIPFTQLPGIDRFILLIGESLLALAWSYGIWLLIGILGSLPKPFIRLNTVRLLRLGWLSFGINIGNGLLGVYFLARLLDYLEADNLPRPPGTTYDLTLDFFSSGLVPSLSIPISVVLGAFALALVFRIGVQHREREQTLEAEQELTV